MLAQEKKILSDRVSREHFSTGAFRRFSRARAAATFTITAGWMGAHSRKTTSIHFCFLSARLMSFAFAPGDSMQSTLFGLGDAASGRKRQINIIIIKSKGGKSALGAVNAIVFAHTCAPSHRISH